MPKHICKTPDTFFFQGKAIPKPLPAFAQRAEQSSWPEIKNSFVRNILFPPWKRQDVQRLQKQLDKWPAPSSECLKDSILTTSSQRLFVWFRFRDCWGGGTRFCFLLFRKAKSYSTWISAPLITWTQLWPGSHGCYLIQFQVSFVALSFLHTLPHRDLLPSPLLLQLQNKSRTRASS